LVKINEKEGATLRNLFELENKINDRTYNAKL